MAPEERLILKQNQLFKKGFVLKSKFMRLIRGLILSKSQGKKEV